MIMTASDLRAQAWLERIRNQLSSGMSVRGWCQGNGINEKTFYHWRKKLSDRFAQIASANMVCENVPVVRTAGRVIPQFSEVKPVSESHCAATVVKGSLRVELSDDISDQMLIRLMKILGHFLMIPQS